MGDLEIVTTSDRPDLDEQASAAFRPIWPEFIFHSSFDRSYLERAGKYFAGFDVLLADGGEVVTGGWGVALAWDGTAASLPQGYDEALITSVTQHEDSVPPDTLVIMAAAVRSGRRGRGLAGQALTALRDRATSAGLPHVIAPVRPTLKSRYPLTPMANFARWNRADGLHLDPWIRAHQRLGATILGAAPQSMTITGTVAEWEDWAKMAFPETGQYIVPDALDPVSIDHERDRGTYLESNLWMQHA
ncbi:MAG: hypothetical protein ABJB47_03150 [Actinomycetota bacterium]